VVTISFFAAIRERIGTPSIQFDASQAANVSQVINRLIETYPVLEEFQYSMLVAVNDSYAKPETPVQSGDTIALFPPVSGGCCD